MNEQELDALIGEALQREKMIEEINHSVMRTVKTRKRESVVRRWLRIAALSFGLPIAVAIVLYTYYRIHIIQGTGSLSAVMMLLAGIFVLGVAGKTFRLFADGQL
ncbi:hypothetical protein [Prevotella dentasini]|uniref:hypothetical protein n=1 Tax=Prevotella dentasini TaxID=589537 RepID=UPI0011DC9F20|nr:hypothetical protein [Prevotella dentasini]